MRILLMYRLMNGLEPILQSGIWSPSGIPTATRLIEALDKSDHEIDLVLYPPEPCSLPKGLDNKKRQYSIEGLETVITFVDYGFLSRMPRRLALNLAPIFRAWWSLRYTRRTSPDIFYTDRGNVIAAAVVARMMRVRTVLRVFGVPAALWEVLGYSYHPLILMMRRAFRGRFDAVIGTRDGSNIKGFLDRALSADVPRYIRTNGHIRPQKFSAKGQTESLSDRTVKIVYLGRLDQGKGAEHMIDAVLSLPQPLRSKCHLTIIGSGPMEAQLRRSVEGSRSAEVVTFLGRLENRQVPAELARHDVYVSLNESGQISNSNIEAASVGLAMIIAETVSGDDADAGKVFDDETVIHIARKSMESGLIEALSELINNPEEIERLKKASIAAAARLPGWDERISWEMDLLESLSTKKL